jgi:hypothetical protein
VNVDTNTNGARHCDACGKPFNETEWQQRHTGHEPGCSYTALGWCHCDRVYHAECCTDCQAKELVWVAVAEWDNGETFFAARSHERLLEKIAAWIVDECEPEKHGIALNLLASHEQIIEDYYRNIEEEWLRIEQVELD